MSEAVARILAQVEALPLQERADLAYAVLCSLEPEDPGAAEAWDAELARRVARLRSGQAVAIPAEQVFAAYRRSQDQDAGQITHELKEPRRLDVGHMVESDGGLFRRLDGWFCRGPVDDAGIHGCAGVQNRRG